MLRWLLSLERSSFVLSPQSVATERSRWNFDGSSFVFGLSPPPRQSMNFGVRASSDFSSARDILLPPLKTCKRPILMKFGNKCIVFDKNISHVPFFFVDSRLNYLQSWGWETHFVRYLENY